MTPPPVSETAAWTRQDERDVANYARGTDAPERAYTYRVACRFAREVLRLRADNERLRVANEALDVAMMANAREVERLRAATRERETPDDGGVPRFENGDPLDEAMYAEWKSSRSRVSDNG